MVYDTTETEQETKDLQKQTTKGRGKVRNLNVILLIEKCY